MAQEIIDNGDHEIVDGDGLGTGAPPSTQPSHWTLGGNLRVGDVGPGFLTIRNGGAVTNAYAAVGFGTGTTGDVIVTGAGSIWTNTSELWVGQYGSGTVTIEDGGAVSGLVGAVGLFAGSTGTVTVTGAGSLWTNSYRLYLGKSGDGALTIADGGAVTAGEVKLALDAATTGTLNIGAAAGDAAVAAGSLDTPRIIFGDGSGTLVFNHTSPDFALDADISGDGTIRLLAGWTRLSGDSSYTGSTLLEGGTLSLGSDTALGTSTLTTTGSVVDYVDGVSIANLIVIDSDTTQFQVLTGSATQSGVISELNGPRPFEKIGNGELVLTAANSWTGLTTVRDGSLTFDGGSVALAADFVVGDQTGDSGALIIENGGTVSNTLGYIGYDTGSTGAATVTGAGSSWANSDDLFVGNAGNGTLTIADGGAVSNTDGGIGYGSGSTGAVTVTGAGSAWTNSDDLAVGYSGNGTLTIADGGAVSGLVGAVGFFPGVIGTVTVTGVGSTWTHSGLSVGYFGNGTLTIADGGAVSDEYGLIGAGSGSIGTVTITGVGSRWANSGSLQVGNFGDGALTIADGGTVSNTLGTIGANSGSTSTVIVTGAGSTWNNSNGLFVGYIGDGTLTIADGGAVSASGVIVAVTATATGTLNIGAAAGDAAVAAGSLDTPTITFGPGTGTLVFNHTSPDFALDADVSGAGTIRLLAGWTRLSGDNSYTGATLLEGGTLSLGSDTALGTSTLTTTGSVVDYVDGVSIANLIVIDSDTTQFQVLTGSATQSGVISELNGPRPFEKIGNGELVLTAANSWTGLTTVRDGSLTFDGGSVALAADFVVGDQTGDSGALIIENGGTVSNTLGYIGYDTGSTGAATVTGAGSSWTNSDDLFVGNAGDGTLTIADGGAVSSLNSLIGFDTGTTGTVTVTGVGSTWTHSQDLLVGFFGNGTLTIADGGAVSDEYGLIGLYPGAIGTVTVTGVGSTWTHSVDLLVGYLGNGALTIANGGAVSDEYGLIGFDTDATGAVTVTGAGSSWTHGEELFVGYYGDGTLTIENGGAVSNTYGSIGYETGSTGAVTVTGVGSTWTNSEELYVGDYGDGTLTVADGGTVSNTYGSIGFDTGTIGTVMVTGAGSTWTNSEELFVGEFGSGTLTIADGGAVEADGVTLAWDTLGTGTLNIGAAAGDAAVTAGSLDTPTITFGPGTGAIVFNHTSPDFALDADISGIGTIHALAGQTTLTGDSSAFSGPTAVSGGDLRVTGGLGGDVTVSGGSLGGSGTVLGAVSVGAGALVGVQGQTLTMGSLSLSSVSSVNVAMGAPAPDVLFAVGGDLVLDGTVNVTDLGGFGAGVYGLISYGGGLTDNGLVVGTTPTGVVAGDLAVQTSVAGRINLISAAGQDLLFWDGGDPTLHDNGAIDGGDGTWSVGGQTWATADGLVSSAMRPNPGFAIFQATAGTVTVDGPGIGVTGMQFAVDGYSVTGDAVELAAAETLIRVGDGTAAGAGMTATIASALTGTGQLVKTDLGTLILTGTNSYGGGVEVRNGTLVGDTASLIGDIANDATMVFDQTTDAIFAGTIAGGGATIKDGAGSLTLTGANTMDWTVRTGALTVGAAAFAGDVTIDTGAAFNFNPAADLVWTGVLSGAGDFGKSGANTLTLTGDSSGFGGATSVLGGLLRINGALGGQVTVSTAGRIGGSGQVGSLILGDGGTLAPGNSIGTLNVAGNLTIAAGSVYEVEVDPAGSASDLIAVAGTATIAGGTVQHIGLSGVYTPVSSYTILTAVGGVTGTFDAVDSDYAFLETRLTYDPNAVRLVLERNDVSFAGVGHTFNQQSTADAIEAGGWGTPLYSALVTLNADNARLAFDQLSGELHGSVRSAMIEDSGQVRGMVGQRLRDVGTDVRGVSMWARAQGSLGHMATDGNAASLRNRTGGLWLGAEAVAAPGLVLGVAAGADSATHDSLRSGQADRDGYQLAAYGSGQWGAFTLSAGVSAAWDDIETKRTAIFPGFAEHLEADYSAETLQTFAEATWSVPVGAAVIEPFASIAHVRTETDAFTETGGVGALSVRKQNQAVTFATLGLGARRSFDDGPGRNGTLGARLGWRHASGDLTAETTQAFAGGTAFTVRGLPVDEDALVAELSGYLALSETMALKVDWTGHAGDHTAQSLSATLNWRF